nr:MAG: ORF1 [Torque teno midi virus]
MPFWWKRRNRWWGGRRRWRWRRRPTRRKRRRLYRRQRYRRTTNRRKRRRKLKVRRKKKTIVLKQWQPDSIRKCKIKGYGILVLGAQGRQLMCYTNMIKHNTIPRGPGGGGFGCQQFSLGSLYTDYLFRKNIWTHTNIYKDLVRYLGVRFTLYRHPETDFIVSYDNQPPFDIEKYTYMYCHPANMLLARHKKIIPSKSTNPNGRTKRRLRIRPPKQMITKWFFSQHFSHAGLLLLKASAMNLQYANLGCCNTNQLVTVYYLDPEFYKLGNWAHQSQATQPYIPYTTVPQTLYFKNPKTGTWDLFNKPATYDKSISYNEGWFSSKVLSAIGVSASSSGTPQLAALPCNVARYNPNYDSGEKSSIWISSAFTADFNKPTSDMTLIMEGYPIWMMLYGFLNYILMVKKDKTFFETHYLLMQSTALFPAPQIGAGQFYLPIDTEMVQGKLPYDEYITDTMKARWFPTIRNQIKTLNALVQCGPFIPKYDQTKNSTWELDYTYQFFFKFGGPEITDPKVVDPQYQPTYDVPDTFQGRIQIKDPALNKASTMFHSWDWRRGLLTKTAIKRMYEHIETDQSVQSDTSSTPKKKKRTGPELNNPQEAQEEIKNCLLSLCEESTCQDQEEEKNLYLLIKQQQQKQLELKRNILKLLQELKDKQRMLQLQTGLLE